MDFFGKRIEGKIPLLILLRGVSSQYRRKLKSRKQQSHKLHEPNLSKMKLFNVCFCRTRPKTAVHMNTCTTIK